MAWREEERFDQFGLELPFAPGGRHRATPEPDYFADEPAFVPDRENLAWLDPQTEFEDEEWLEGTGEAEDFGGASCECEGSDAGYEYEAEGEYEVEEEPAFESEWADLLPALAADDAIAQALYSSEVRTRLEPLLDVARAKTAAKWNRDRHPAKSAIDASVLLARLDRYVDRAAIERAMQASADLRSLASDQHAVLAVVAHQFQQKVYTAPPAAKKRSDPRDGMVGEGSLDALGFVRHRDKALNATDSKNIGYHVGGNYKAYRRIKEVYRSQRPLFDALGADVTPANWFYLFANPPFLGRPFRSGVHIELVRRLRLAEAWLMAQPQYRGMSPVQIGAALGIDEEHAGGRQNATSSMHTLGLAVDIGYVKNPWVAGQHGNAGRNAKFQAASRNAALLISGADETLTPGWLKKQGNTAGTTTEAAYTAIRDRHARLVAYLALRNDQPALLAAIQRRVSAGGANLVKVMRPQESADAAAVRWRQTIVADHASLQNALAGGSAARRPDDGFLNLHRDLVVALRDHGCLAWGAIDLSGENGDMMHFDCRSSGLGLALSLPQQRTTGTNHPCYTAPAPSREYELDEAPAPKPASPPTAHAGGKLWSFTASALPLRIGIFVPQAVIASPGQVELLVYGHGLLNPCKPVPAKMPDDLFTKAPFRLADIVSRSGRATVLVVPSLEWPNVTARKLGFGRNGKQHQLGRPDTFNAVMDEVLREIGRVLGTGRPQLANLIVSGHSRAYDLIDPLAAGHAEPAMSRGALAKLTAVWALDTTYAAPVADYRAWIAAKPELQVDVLFRCGSSTEKGGLAFDKAALGTGGRLRVAAVCEGHCGVPVRRLPLLLERLPGAGAGSVTREFLEDERFAWSESEFDDAYEEFEDYEDEAYDLEDGESTDLELEGLWESEGFAWEDEAGSEECESGDWESEFEDEDQPVAVKPAFTVTKVKKGFKSHGGERVDTVLRRLIASGKTTIAAGDVEVLERLSRVESSGFVACVQTYDSAYLSFGFMQYTILYGELQNLIARVPQAFARYGIVLEGSYTFKKRRVPGIRGAPRASDLRAREWVERFMRAGLDDDIVAAQALKGIEDVEKLTQRLKRVMGAKWSTALASARVRALVAEAHNNRPVVMWGAKGGHKGAARVVADSFVAGGEPAFVRLLVAAIHEAYSLRDELDKGKRLTSKILA